MSASGYSNALGKIRLRFLSRLADQYEKSRELTQDWSDRQENTESLEEFCAIAHKIAGLAKSVGFPDLGSAAFEADSTIQKWLADGDCKPSETEVAAAIESFLESCSRALNSDEGNNCDGT